MKRLILLLLSATLSLSLSFCFCTCYASDDLTTVESGYNVKSVGAKKIFDLPKRLGKRVNKKAAKVLCKVISKVDSKTESKINKILRPVVDDICGLVYDPIKDVYYTREDSFQKYFGFGDLFDECGPALGMNIDELPIVFRYKNGDNQEQEWLIELWKGQYGSGLSTGAEIGIYNRLVTDDMHEYNKGQKNYKVFFDSAKGKDKMHLAYTLYGKGEKVILSGNSSEYPKPIGEEQDKDWWLLRIKFGEYNDKEDLKLDAEIEFLDKGMAKEFKKAIEEQFPNKVTYVERTGRIVRFYWEK